MRMRAWVVFAAMVACGGRPSDDVPLTGAATFPATGGDASGPGDRGDSEGSASSGPHTSSTGGSADGSTGPVVSCANEIFDGDETDVDCGGSCQPCDEGLACTDHADCVSGNCDGGACGWATSCLSIKTARPDASTRSYVIHPDNTAASIEVWCDMDRNGGGWTLTFAANGPDFDVGHAVPVTMMGSVPLLFETSAARYTQYPEHTEEMFVCTTGADSTLYEVRTFDRIPRFWDQALDNAEIFLTGTQGTPNASATEYCAGLVWGGCNLEHRGYAVFNAAFGTANWGRWSANTYYGPTGGDLDCFGSGDQASNDAAWFWHYVR